MKLVGSVGSYSSNEVLFAVEVINGCSTTPFNTSPINSDSYYFQQTTALTLGQADWTTSDVNCPPISYTIRDANTDLEMDTSIFIVDGTNVNVVAN